MLHKTTSLQDKATASIRAQISKANPVSIERWAFILPLTGVGSFILCFSGETIANKFTATAIAAIGSCNYWAWGIWLSIALGLIPLFGIHTITKPRLKHEQHWTKQPPIHLAITSSVIIGLPFATITASPQNTSDWLGILFPPLTSAYYLLSIVIYRVLTLWASNHHIDDTKIHDEAPITSHEMDEFEFKHIAERILSVLKKTEQKKCQTIGLLGEHGSGKSSICNMIKSLSNENCKNNFIFTTVSCWNIENPIETQRHILDSILNELNEEIECLPIRQVPDDYISAMGDSSNIIKSLLVPIKNYKTPLERLKEISPLLHAVNKNLIIIIEDLDRADNNQARINNNTTP